MRRWHVGGWGAGQPLQLLVQLLKTVVTLTQLFVVDELHLLALLLMTHVRIRYLTLETDDRRTDDGYRHTQTFDHTNKQTDRDRQA